MEWTGSARLSIHTRGVVLAGFSQCISQRGDLLHLHLPLAAPYG